MLESFEIVLAMINLSLLRVSRLLQEKLTTTLDDNEINHVETLNERLEDLARFANEKDVAILVDGEHTYFQTAIRYVALSLMKKFNKEKTTVINTYQNYLKVCFK